MASLEQLQSALMNADKAGDAVAARALAGEIMRMHGQKVPQSISAAEQTNAFNQMVRSDLTGEMSGGQRFRAGMGKAFTDVARGAGQLIGAGPSGAEVGESRRLDAPLMATRGGIGGNLAGNVAIAAPTALIPGANTYAGAALIGGGMGALQPVEDAGERARNIGTGAIVAPAALAAGRGLARGIGGIRAAVQPVYKGGQDQIIGSLLRKAAGENADDAVAAMRSAQPLVPGSNPTAGQVANSGGIAALERAAAQAEPESYAARQIEQNMARLNALRGISGTDAQMQAAVQARDAASAPLYRAAREAGIDREMAKAMQPQLQNLMERMPKGVLAHARELARIEGETIDKAGSVSGLHYVKKAIDDLLSRTGDTGLGNISRRALAQYQDDLLSTIDELSPLYAQGRSAYSSASAPINQMEVGRALLKKLEPALTEGNVPIRMNAESFARALREGDTLAQQATGFNGATLSRTMKPEQLATLNALRDDLARSATAATLGRGVGSNTFQNLAQENLMQAAGIHNLPQLLSRPVQLTNYALRAVYGSANEEMKKRLAQALLNPQETAGLMQAAVPSRTSQLLAEVMKRAEPAVPAMAAGAAMSQK